MTTLSLVATAEPGNVPPRIRVDVTDTGSSPAITAATVTRTDNSGRTVPVRTLDGNPLTLVSSGSNRIGTVYDYEMRYGNLNTYSTNEQPANKSAQVSVASARPWLVHPGVPSRSMPITVQSVGSREYKVKQGVFYPLGRSSAVVVTDGRRGAAASQLGVLTQSDAERRQMSALIDDAGVLLLNVPASSEWGIEAEYVAIGDVTEDRPSRFIGTPDRVFQVPYFVVDAPVGGSQSQWTWASVVAKHATWQDVINNNATWAAVQAPTN